MDYLLLKWIHVVSSTILFGTGIGSAFFLFMANRRGEVEGIRFAIRHVVIADWLFTTSAVIVQLITGLSLAYVLDIDILSGWLFWALLVFIFVGTCWLLVVWIQIKMRNLVSKTSGDTHELPDLYWRLEKWWMVLGWLAFPAVVLIFWLMVFKPEL